MVNTILDTACVSLSPLPRHVPPPQQEEERNRITALGFY